MAYEFNPDSSRFNLPNPHAVENIFLGVIIAALSIGGLIAVVNARGNLLADEVPTAVAQILIGAWLLGYAVRTSLRLMRQLNFFFGRDQPIGYWDDINVVEAVRQNAITFATPKTPLDQLLYRLAPSLVFSPRRVQAMARAKFADIVNLVAVAGCYAVCCLSSTDAAVASWAHALFAGLFIHFVISPLLSSTGGKLRPWLLITLLIISIVAPIASVAAGLDIPLVALEEGNPLNVNYAAVNVAVILLTLVFGAIFIAALLNMMTTTGRINSVNAMERLRMNAHPRQLLVEFDRLMQDSWTEKIPNRVYRRTEPQASGEAGAFKGSAFEETQPVPADSRAITLGFALSDKRYRFLVVLDVLALTFTTIGSFILATGIGSLSTTTLIIGGLLILTSAVFLRSSNFMWRRFEYHSRAYWLEIDGNFSASRVDLGRQLDDRIRSQKTVINIEDMTLRVWVADLYSVNFDVNDGRDLIGMVGVHSAADEIKDTLVRFAEAQRVFVAPTSNRDQAAIASVNAASPLPQVAPSPQEPGRALLVVDDPSAGVELT